MDTLTNLVFPSLHSSHAGHTSREQFSGVNQLWQLVLGVSRKHWHFKIHLPLGQEGLWGCDKREYVHKRDGERRNKKCEMVNVPGCLPGRGSRTEKGGRLWDCAPERCSLDTLSVSLSYAPGRRRTINVNIKLKCCTLLMACWFYSLQAGQTVRSHREQRHQSW